MVNQSAIPHTDNDSEIAGCPKTTPVNTTFIPVCIVNLTYLLFNNIIFIYKIISILEPRWIWLGWKDSRYYTWCIFPWVCCNQCTRRKSSWKSRRKNSLWNGSLFNRSSYCHKPFCSLLGFISIFSCSFCRRFHRGNFFKFSFKILFIPMKLK